MKHLEAGYVRNAIASRLLARGASMRLLRPKPAMTSGEFKTALRAAGFGVENGRIVDVSGTCPGFTTIACFRNGEVDRNATFEKVIRERNDEISRRSGAT